MPAVFPSPDGAGIAEAVIREKLAAYFLTAPPWRKQTPAARQVYAEKLACLSRLDRDGILHRAGTGRPLLWGNPVPYMQALLSAAQELGAGLGQPVLLFPAKETHILFRTLLDPRILGISLMTLLADACRAAPRQPVWVRLSEQRHCVTAAVSGAVPFGDGACLELLKENTRLHRGSLVQWENTVSFSCGQAEAPPNAKLFDCPTAEDLLRDSLSPVWTAFYSAVYPVLSGAVSAEGSVSEEGSSSEGSSEGSPSDASSEEDSSGSCSS